MPKSNNFKKYLVNSNPLSMYLKPTSKTKISKIVTNLDSTKISGPDEILVRLIISCVDNLSGPLANIKIPFTKHSTTCCGMLTKKK